jgi:hypothetical protein
MDITKITAGNKLIYYTLDLLKYDTDTYLIKCRKGIKAKECNAYYDIF